MQNLAGLPTEEIDSTLRNELTRCGIEIVEGESADHPEVKATVRGRLGEIRLHRNWYYWVAVGKIPMDVASKLYAHPVGQTDIRVNGDCTRPAPGTPGGMPDWFTEDGVHLIDEAERGTWERCFREKSEEHLRIANARFSDNKARDGNPFITCYHIDSELGLYLFAESLR